MAYTGTTYKFYDDLINAPSHVLIAGMTGSGKSVIINGMINSILYESTDEHIMVLIDPKRVELSAYKNTPHCGVFATEMFEIERALDKTLKIIENRFTEMETNGERMYHGARLHVFVDEMADLMLTSKRAADLIQRIAQIGRAANVQLVCATQCPLASVIPTRIQVNFGNIIGLHTRNAQDSRNIIGESGCERLPRYGRAIIRYSNEVEMKEVEVPMVSDEDLDGITRYRTQEFKNTSKEPVIEEKPNNPIVKTGKDFTKTDNIEWKNKDEIMNRMSYIYRNGGLL